MSKRKLLRINYKEYEKPKFLRLLTVLLLRAYIHILLKFRISGITHLPKGPKIFAINHPTATDPFIIGSIFPNASILITKEAFDSRFSNWLLKSLGHIPVDRKNGKAAYDEARNILLKNKDIIIFPEGGFSKNLLTMKEIKTGLARLALETRATIVPIGVSLKKRGLLQWKMRNRKGQQYTAKWYIFSKYFVNIGKSIKLKGSHSNRKHVHRKSIYLKEEIQKLSRKYFYKPEIFKK